MLVNTEDQIQKTEIIWLFNRELPLSWILVRMIATAHVNHTHLSLTHPKPFLLRREQILNPNPWKDHLPRRAWPRWPSESESSWWRRPLDTAFELRTRGTWWEERRKKSMSGSFLLLVTDVVGNVFNEEQDGRPEFHWSSISNNNKVQNFILDLTLVCCKFSKPRWLLLLGPQEPDSLGSEQKSKTVKRT